MTPGLLLLAAMVVAMVAVLGLRQYWIAWEDRRERINRSALTRVEAQAGTIRYRIDRRLRRTRFGAMVESELAAAGLPWSVLAGAGAVVGIMAAVYLVVDSVAPWWAGLLALYGGWRVVQAFLLRRRGQRVDAFVAQLPELARTISNAAAAGRSLPSAIRMASRELEDPAATELRVVAEELRIGRSLDDALERLQDRLPSREVGVMTTTLLIQQRSGGDLVKALREMAETLDKRKDLRAEIRTLMAGSVFTGYAVVALGVGAIVLVNAVAPGAIDAMLSSWAGRVAMLVAAGLYAVGLVLIRNQQSIDI